MGRKKKFIEKSEGSTFHVVHRSQQDKAAEGEEAPSEFVLIPSAPRREKKTNRLGEGDGSSEGGTANDKRRALEERDHINSLGLPNDGYDYEQHIKSMGGGTFVSRHGRVQHYAKGRSSGAEGVVGDTRRPGLAIPEEALPSQEMLDRQLEAITISEKVMDNDLRRALAGGVEGVDEGFDELEADGGNWLNDDFVLQAAAPSADEGGTFDFDAHVARLMEASVRETGLRERTADDNLDVERLARVRRPGDESSDEEGEEGRSDASGSFDEALLEGLDIKGGDAAGAKVEDAERVALEADFEATLAAYDSDEWGELDEDDEEVQGRWDLEEHKYANTCMDEFLATKEETAWSEGLQRLPPEQRNILATSSSTLTSRANDASREGNGDGGNPGGSPTAVVAASSTTLGDGVVERASASADDVAEGRAAEREVSAGGGKRGQDEEGGIGVVAPPPVSGGPRLGRLKGLMDPGEGVRRKTVTHELEEDKDEDEDEVGDVEGFFAQLQQGNEYLRVKEKQEWDCETIVSTYSNLDNHPSMIKTLRKKDARRRPRQSSSSVEAPEESSPSGGFDKVGDGDEGNAVGRVVLSARTGLPMGVLPERIFDERGMVSLAAGKNTGEKRDADETLQEKRQRKALTKQQKKNKRVQKKSLKKAFTSETKIVTTALSNTEAPQNRSIFSYS